ncbi:MAG: AraC family transcriptional regulator [Bradyrhizobium sp.]|uniref:AraC family transcriptional regulator n=1 Tax=Bradyrhizobium sp. TaxID=376 RepID=UPI0025BC3C48|nr:helix-turn-helix transcriptional regulator [Bradyrhizobium sp.]MBI5264564.1 AraC family transcriptional regulator [Bradyrhizobium sp.]
MPNFKGTFLSRYPVLDSRDAELAQDRLFSVYGAIGFDKGEGRFGLRANHLQLSNIALSYCEYHSPTSVTFPEASFFRQCFSIDGAARFTWGNSDAAAIGPWTPAISGTAPLRLDFGEDYRQLVLRVNADALRRTIDALVGNGSDRELIFFPEKEDVAAQSIFRRKIFEFATEMEAFGTMYSPLAMAELERTIVMRFLFAHQHNFSDLLWREPLSANRSAVDKVTAFIEANWDKPLDVEQLAAIAHVSVRTLFREFARAGRGSPAEFAKRIRLERAADLLSHPTDTTSVTSVAFRCGFQNIGRFARDYTLLFGELPSVTLKRALRAA